MPKQAVFSVLASYGVFGQIFHCKCCSVQWAENQMKLDFAVLRNTQGIYAPLHLKCELDVANRVNAVQLGDIVLYSRSYKQMLQTCRLYSCHNTKDKFTCIVTA